MKRNIKFILLFLCFACSMSAQDICSVHKLTICFPDLGRAMPLGMGNAFKADTTHWRNPKSMAQCVLSFDTTQLTLEQKTEKLKLLGFFYNPKVVKFDKRNGMVVLNTKRYLYRKNGIKLIYRKFVKQYYDEVNHYIKEHKNNNPVDEDFFLEQFEFLQRDYCRDIKE
jgi:hypothetical protein